MFAVVRFLEENTISEVPSKWLDENQCWWPHRNSKTHIIKADVPGSTKGTFWQKYDVEILKTELTYNEARKKAGQDSMSSEDDTATGPGKRNIIRKCFPDNNTDQDSDDDTLLSCQPKFNNNEKKPRNKLHVFNIEEIPIVIAGELGGGELGDDIQDSVEDLNNGTIITNPAEEKDPLEETTKNKEPPSLSTEVLAEVSTMKQNLSNHDENQNIIRMFAKILLTLESIDKRLKNLEDKHSQNRGAVYEESALILQFIPFEFDSLKEIDSLLKSNEEIRKQMKSVIVQVGGNNPKDFIYRVLTKIFPNECAVKCSWKGLKNNFAVCNLIAIKIMKEQVLQSFPYSTEKEVENITAEWFRFARQRLERQLKKNTQPI